MNEYKGIWIIGEQKEGIIQSITYELLARALELKGSRAHEISIVIFGNIHDAELKKIRNVNADYLLQINDRRVDYFLPEPYANILYDLVQKRRPEIIIAGATSSGRTIMPLVATRCRTGLTADCTKLEFEEKTGHLLQSRPAIGGNIMATIKCADNRPQMATVRPKSFSSKLKTSEKILEIITMVPEEKLFSSSVKRIKFTPISENSSNIQESDVIAAGGRGLKKKENFKLINRLAALLGGCAGATRDAVDRGWAAYPQQIGLSGKTVSPKLYFCAGVSGSVQHLAGIKTAANIIAVNNDCEAQIFKIADLGIAADLFELLPLLIEKIEKSRKSVNDKNFSGAEHE
ncbi:MAG: electron transfer flavoprotein subunit alpha [Spirochaetes bacterium GWF1_41_5]|nr:MAG: electron transfer flavoprotein subunit alpha [Spirochaetes bacterium GWF1_41_5]